MLENMRQTRVIRGICLETNRKDIIAVVPSDVQVFGTCFVVLKLQGREFELGNVLDALHCEAMESFAWLRKLLGDGCIRPAGAPRA